MSQDSNNDRVDVEALLRSRPFLRTLARSLLRDIQDQEDAVQETIRAALASEKRIENLNAWLSRTLRNIAMRMTNARAIPDEISPTSREDGPEAQLARTQLSEALVRFVLSLGSPDTSIVLAHYYEQLPLAKIAANMQMNERTVATRLSRARDKLRERLEREGFGGPDLKTGLASIAGLPTISAPRPRSAPLIQLGAVVIVVLAAVVGVAWVTAGAPGGIGSFSLEGTLPFERERVATERLEGPAVRREAEEVADAATAPSLGRAAVEPPRFRAVLGGPGPGRRVPAAGYAMAIDVVGGAVPPATLEVVTDANGEFGVDRETWSGLDRTRPIELVVRSGAGALPIERRHLVAPGQPPPDGAEAYVLPIDAHLEVIVLDEEGRPLPGARVIAPGAQAVTDASGRADLPASSYLSRPSIWVEAEGYARFEEMVSPPLSETTVTHVLPRLRRELRVAGRAFDSADREVGVPDAEITIPGLLHRSWTSDANGAFVLDGLDPQERFFVLRVAAPGRPAVTAVLERGQATLEVPVGWGPYVTGAVTDESGSPVSGASVRLGEPAGAASVPSVHTDAAGGFRTEPVSPGTWTVVVERRGHAPARTRVEVHEAMGFARVDVVLGRGRTVRGRVFDAAGAPIAWASIGAADSEGRALTHVATRTDERGAFELEGVPDEPVVVRAAADGFAGKRASVEATLAGEVLLELEPLARLRVKTVDAVTGEPVDARSVRFVGSERLESLDPALAFTLANVEVVRSSGGEFEFDFDAATPGSLAVFAPGYVPAVVEVNAGRESTEVALRHGARLGGALVTRAGDSAADALVRLERRGGTPVERVRAVGVDAAGRFELTILEPGTYEVSVLRGGEPVEFTGSTTVEVVAGIPTPELLLELR